jgi:hypothetical protein
MVADSTRLPDWSPKWHFLATNRAVLESQAKQLRRKFLSETGLWIAKFKFAVQVLFSCARYCPQTPLETNTSWSFLQTRTG